MADSPFAVGWKGAAVIDIVNAIGGRWPSEWIARANAIHLATLREPWASYVADGSKRVESRWGAVQCAPHGQIGTWDLVAWRRTGGRVYGVSIVTGATTTAIRDDIHAFNLLRAHADDIRVGLDYPIVGKRWLTLITFDGLLPVDVDARKVGASGWDVLQTRGGLFGG